MIHRTHLLHHHMSTSCAFFFPSKLRFTTLSVSFMWEHPGLTCVHTSEQKHKGALRRVPIGCEPQLRLAGVTLLTSRERHYKAHAAASPPVLPR